MNWTELPHLISMLLFPSKSQPLPCVWHMQCQTQCFLHYAISGKNNTVTSMSYHMYGGQFVFTPSWMWREKESHDYLQEFSSVQKQSLSWLVATRLNPTNALRGVEQTYSTAFPTLSKYCISVFLGWAGRWEGGCPATDVAGTQGFFL